MKRKLHKAWQTFLVVSVVVATIGIIFWACCLDSESWIPTIMLGINAGWLLWMFVCNNPARIEKEKENRDVEDKKNHNRHIQGRAS